MTARTLYMAIVFIAAVSLSSSRVMCDEPKINVSDVDFKGNDVFSSGRLKRVMLTRPPGMFRKNRYSPEILTDDLAAIERLYRQEGYLEAAVLSHTVEIDSTRWKARIEIMISEGEQTITEDVGILDNNVFPDDVLMKYVAVVPGEPFRRKNVDDTTVALLTHYADNGYLNAEVRPDVRVDSLAHRALVDFIVTEKAQYTVGGIVVSGLDKTRQSVVARELLFETGDVINYTHLLESQRNIYLTGLFQNVYIRPGASAEDDSTKKNINVDVVEGMSGEFNVAVGYGSIDRARSRIEVYNNNLRGTALKLGVVGKVSFVQRGLEGSFTDPWTFGTKWRTDINMLTERKIEPDYAFDRTGGKLSIGRTIRKNTVTFAFRQEHVQLRDVKTTEIPVALTSNTRSLKLTFVSDLRNNLFNATEGMYIETSSEYGGYYTARTSGFLRLLATFKYFYPIYRDVVAATSFETGWIDNRQGFRSIPLQERFYIGGPNSLRGFKYTKAGDLDERGKAIGGSFKIQWNVVEFRRALYKMIGGVVFADVGNVWQHAADVRFRDLRSDAGAGLRINTPIGLARLDYGFNLDRKPGEPPGQLYFSMGQAF